MSSTRGRNRKFVRKRKSISRWAKDHRDELSQIDFQKNKRHPLRNWRTRKEYDRWRRDVLINDNFRCVNCGTKESLTVHHKIPASVAPALSYVDWNGETLCDPCHRKQLHQYDDAFWIRLIGKRR